MSHMTICSFVNRSIMFYGIRFSVSPCLLRLSSLVSESYMITCVVFSLSLSLDLGLQVPGVAGFPAVGGEEVHRPEVRASAS